MNIQNTSTVLALQSYFESRRNYWPPTEYLQKKYWSFYSKQKKIYNIYFNDSNRTRNILSTRKPKKKKK